jgi:hypothetical protein
MPSGRNREEAVWGYTHTPNVGSCADGYYFLCHLHHLTGTVYPDSHDAYDELYRHEADLPHARFDGTVTQPPYWEREQDLPEVPVDPLAGRSHSEPRSRTP